MFAGVCDAAAAASLEAPVVEALHVFVGNHAAPLRYGVLVCTKLDTVRDRRNSTHVLSITRLRALRPKVYPSCVMVHPAMLSCEFFFFVFL